MTELVRQQQSNRTELDRQEKRKKDLQNEQLKLIEMRYADAIPIELLKSEQERIARDLAAESETTDDLTPVRARQGLRHAPEAPHHPTTRPARPHDAIQRPYGPLLVEMTNPGPNDRNRGSNITTWVAPTGFEPALPP